MTSDAAASSSSLERFASRTKCHNEPLKSANGEKLGDYRFTEFRVFVLCFGNCVLIWVEEVK